MQVFVDTNVIIAYLFLFEPFNHKSNVIFDEYCNVVLSNCVCSEVNKVSKDKLKNLFSFFNHLKEDIINISSYEFSLDELIRYVKNKNYDEIFLDVNGLLYSFGTNM